MKFYNQDINKIAINALIDCGEISLPNIGALRCKLLSASIKNDSITPPRQIVEFHCLSSAGVTSLTQLIAWSYTISNEEAEIVYNSWLDSIKTETSTDTIYNIEGLGSICISSNNCTVFSTDKTFLLQLNPLTQEFPQEKPQPSCNQTVDNSLYENLDVAKEEGNELFWKNMATVFITLFIIAASCATYFYMEEPKEVIREIKIEKIVTDTIYANQATTGSITDNKITNGKFHVIAGVFKSEANAQKAVKEQTKDGVTPVMEFIKEREEYFVSIGCFNTQQEAQNQINKLGLVGDSGLESYWIYKY